jgi:Fatty acid hydroxylase superfamily
MRLLSFEHGRAAYRADFVLYGAAVAGLSVLLLAVGPSGHGLALGASLLAGVLGWSLIEYLLHRFVLHGVAPFRRWHEQHHARPTALICTPTLLSATLIGLFVFLPVALLGDRWMACALTLGLLVGYLGYAVTHHAIHHWRGDGAWQALACAAPPPRRRHTLLWRHQLVLGSPLRHGGEPRRCPPAHRRGRREGLQAQRDRHPPLPRRKNPMTSCPPTTQSTAIPACRCGIDVSGTR